MTKSDVVRRITDNIEELKQQIYESTFDKDIEYMCLKLIDTSKIRALVQSIESLD